MRTLRHAAALLSASTPDGLLALATTLGFDGAALSLDDATRASLELPPELIDVRLVRGRGALRALLVVGHRPFPCARCSRRSPPSSRRARRTCCGPSSA